MAKFRVLYLVLLVLVICSVFLVSGQQQNRRRKGSQLQQGPRNRQKQRFDPDRPRPIMRFKKKNANNKNKEGKPEKNTKTMVNHHIAGLGSVRGRVIKSEWSDQEIVQFFDIPYANGPIGALRFKPATPIKEWSGTLKAEKPFFGCPQLQDITDYDELRSRNVEVEDCLRLTISTKSFTESSPVMVYIHGDFLYDGSSLEAAPGYLLEEDVVLVGVRYRLGPFGFLSTMTEDIPGNAGVTDVILALKWIQNHIASFGGDPTRVTLFGQVAGSALINVLTMSPAVPEGLFHRVIYQSGTAMSPAFITDNPLPAAKDIAKFAGCKNIQKVEALNRCLRRLNTTDLLEAFALHGSAKTAEGVGSTGGAQFVVGGPSNILPFFPAKILTSGNIKTYPTMGGTTKNAGSFTLRDIFIDNFNETIIDDQMDALGYINHIISETNGADPSGAWKKYAEEEVFTPKQLKNGTFQRLVPGLIDLCSTIAYKNPVLLAMQGNAKKMGNNTYLYSFEYEGEQNRYSTSDDETGNMPFELGVSLTDENLYLFPYPRYTLINSNSDLKIAKRMVKLWTSFASTGKPSAPNVPEWPSMTGDAGPYLKIGKTVSVGNNYIDEFNAAINDVQMGYNLVNDDFFQSFVETNNDHDKESNENDDDDDDDNNEDESASEARGNIVLIAHRNKF